MNVFVIPMLQDNFCYYVHRPEDLTKGFFVDVSQPQVLQQFMHKFGISKPTHIFTTHKHHDHSGGNADIKNTYPELEVVGGSNDNIPSCTLPVNDGDTLDIHGLKIKCMHTPCHTRGHILYYVEASTPSLVDQEESKQASSTDFERSKVHDYQLLSNINRCVFTGDTLFIGGCGRFFEGKPEEMQSAMDRLSGDLPPDTKVFCGHEYTIKNLEFGMMAEPDNQDIINSMKHYQKLIDQGFHSVPSTISEEAAINVFMRTKQPSVKEACGLKDPVQCMQFLREYKNSGQRPNL
eukprot:403376163